MSAAERAELIKLRKQVAGQETDLAFLGKRSVLRIKSTKAERFALMEAECTNFEINHHNSPTAGGVLCWFLTVAKGTAPQSVDRPGPTAP